MQDSVQMHLNMKMRVFMGLGMKQFAIRAAHGLFKTAIVELIMKFWKDHFVHHGTLNTPISHIVSYLGETMSGTVLELIRLRV